MGPKIKIMHFIHQVKCKLKIDDKPESKSEFGGGDVKKLRNSKLRKRAVSCWECGKTYSKHQYVIDHNRTVHLNSVMNYSCKVCGQTFGWKVNILKHIKKSHPEKKTIDMIDVLF